MSSFFKRERKKGKREKKIVTKRHQFHKMKTNESILHTFAGVQQKCSRLHQNARNIEEICCCCCQNMQRLYNKSNENNYSYIHTKFIRVKIRMLNYGKRESDTHTANKCQKLCTAFHVISFRFVSFEFNRMRTWNEHKEPYARMQTENATSLQCPFAFGTHTHVTIYITRFTWHNLDFLIDILNFKCLHFGCRRYTTLYYIGVPALAICTRNDDGMLSVCMRT